MTYGNGQAQPSREPVERVVDLFVHTPIGLAVMAWKRFPELVGSMPDLVGQVVSRGCAQLSEAEAKVTDEVRKARMIGQFAVTFGGRQLRREVDARLRDVRQAAGGATTFLPGGGADGRPDGVNGGGAPSVSTADTPTEPASPPEAPTPSAAAAKAATKPPGARKATRATGSVKASKTTGARKSTRTAAARKPTKSGPASAADLPIREYDGLSASQVVSRLTGLTPRELQAVRSYEERSRGRRTVLLAIDRLLG